jgi:intein/homing endonuclease
MNESTVKYLAGLFDADGSVSFLFRKHNEVSYLSLCLQIAQKDKSLLESFEVGNITTCSKGYSYLRVTAKNELEKLIPRISKHSIIKGKHLMRMLEKYREYRSKALTDSEVEQLRIYAKMSRKDPGPIREKNYPTWAWLAGYLDGDGWYRMREDKEQNYMSMSVGAVAHPDDAEHSLKLIQKQFKGTIRPHGQSNALVWNRNLGVSDSTFALEFLRKLVRHARLKKHKIETMIHFHSQRLNQVRP